MRTIRLLGNRLLLDIEPRRWPAGCPHLVDKWHPPATARVFAVGSKVNLPVAAGQRVGFRPMQGRDIEFDGKKLRLVKPADIVGLLLAPDQIDLEQ